MTWRHCLTSIRPCSIRMNGWTIWGASHLLWGLGRGWCTLTPRPYSSNPTSNPTTHPSATKSRTPTPASHYRLLQPPLWTPLATWPTWSSTLPPLCPPSTPPSPPQTTSPLPNKRKPNPKPYQAVSNKWSNNRLQTASPSWSPRTKQLPIPNNKNCPRLSCTLTIKICLARVLSNSTTHTIHHINRISRRSMLTIMVRVKRVKVCRRVLVQVGVLPQVDNGQEG